jgi:hypothetical protein
MEFSHLILAISTSSLQLIRWVRELTLSSYSIDILIIQFQYMTTELLNHTLLLQRHGVFSHLTDALHERLERMLQGSLVGSELDLLITMWHQGDYLSLPQGSELFFRTNMLLMRMGRPLIDACNFESFEECMQEA